MNAGLTGLMMHLINAGDEKKRQKEYDRRQQAGEERQNRMLLAREALARQHEVERQAYLEGKQQQEEIRKSLATQKKIDDERAVRMAEVDYGLKTIKQKGNEPFTEWDAEEQAAALRLGGGDLVKTMEIIADVQNGVTGHAARAKALKAQADVAKATNEISAETAIAPEVARRATESGIFTDTKMRLGGASPFESANSPNVVQFDPTSGASTVSASPFAKPDKDADLAALMGGSTNSLGKLVAPRVNTITKNPAAMGFNADGSLTTPQKTHYNVPVATPSSTLQSLQSPFAQKVTAIQAQDASAAPTLRAPLESDFNKMVMNPTYTRQKYPKQELDLDKLGKLVEEFRKKQDEEITRRSYNMPADYINQFAP